jgi:phosphocarrier protein HPr
MIRTDIEIINKLGLHARAASKLVNLASQFSSSVFIENKGNKVNAKSIMGVMMLAASQGTQLVLEVDGDDETKCSESIIQLINNRFDEGE